MCLTRRPSRRRASWRPRQPTTARCLLAEGEGYFNGAVLAGTTTMSAGPPEIDGSFVGRKLKPSFRTERNAFAAESRNGDAPALASPDGLRRGTYRCERPLLLRACRRFGPRIQPVRAVRGQEYDGAARVRLCPGRAMRGSPIRHCIYWSQCYHCGNVRMLVPYHVLSVAIDLIRARDRHCPRPRAGAEDTAAGSCCA